MLWKDGTEVSIKSFSKHHIDAVISLNQDEAEWRFTGFYGSHNRQRRSDSWALLKHLSSTNSIPWAVMGDFNDIFHVDEKRGEICNHKVLLLGSKMQLKLVD